jgi:23S rRNA (guanine745-N1)-methyltransferase
MNCYVDLLICPICGERFSSSQRVLTCANKHTFDLALEGYVNLNRSHRSGDTAAMLSARRRFLDRGHLRPLADTIGGLAQAHLRVGNRQPTAILDAGCGEGH